VELAGSKRLKSPCLIIALSGVALRAFLTARSTIARPLVSAFFVIKLITAENALDPYRTETGTLDDLDLLRALTGRLPADR
jgi:hypothetical protein